MVIYIFINRKVIYSLKKEKGYFIKDNEMDLVENTKIIPEQSQDHPEQSGEVPLNTTNITSLSVEVPKVSVKDSFFSTAAVWYWLTILLATFATIAIFLVPEDLYPLIYFRSLFALLLIMFLPGYASMQLFFSKGVPIRTDSATTNTLEYIMLSIGLSLAMSSFLGFLLNYTPFGVRLTSVTLVLLVFTIVLATLAVLRVSIRGRLE